MADKPGVDMSCTVTKKRNLFNKTQVNSCLMLIHNPSQSLLLLNMTYTGGEKKNYPEVNYCYLIESHRNLGLEKT